MRNEEYPVNREWKQKAFSMPKLPGGDDGLEKHCIRFYKW